MSYSVFVSYFPLLVAGPIERATHLLPQIENKRKFNYDQSMNGVRLMIWGFFKKIAIADSLAPIVDDIFKNHNNYSGLILITGAIFFSMQIYADFSGYTDIARGVSKLFGIELLLNFNLPYFSKSIPEFWKRWHISLSGWFRDYLYIPLGGSRNGRSKAIRNIFIVFLISGFWHGANWTFIIWGSIHAVLYIPFFLRGANKPELQNASSERLAPGLKNLPEILLTFSLVCFAWIFFRSDSLNDALQYISGLTRNHNHRQYLNPYNNHPLYREYFLIIFLLILEFCIYNKKYFGSFWERPIASAVLLVVLIVLILTSLQLNVNHAFIYFQF
ncbi:MAG: MBOAT family O-acyltransferase [Chitinophagaceae bacterium]